MNKWLLIGILALLAASTTSMAADDDALDQGPSAAEVKAFKRSKLSFTAFYSLANQLEGQGTSSGTGADGQFTNFYEASGALGIGVNYSVLRFWRMRMDLGLQIEMGRGVDTLKVETENANSSTSVSIDIEPYIQSSVTSTTLLLEKLSFGLVSTFLKSQSMTQAPTSLLI